MSILISYLKTPLLYFRQGPDKFQESYRKRYVPFLRNLQESVTQSFKYCKSVITLKPKGAVIKTEGLAAKILQSQAKSTVNATNNPQEILPLDPKTVLKKLDNGFTYYIRRNAYPSKETASLRLVVRAGSTDEKEHEQGLAHFLEHLLFEGTKSYKKHDIKRFLESKGVFGADQNAYTSYNKTVYKFDIPLNDTKLLDKTLHILREMATEATITKSSVEEERKVILDEISAESASKRYNNKRITALFEGTPYPHRHPAGLKTIIQKCTPEEIRAFYKRNYRAQEMALIYVGDSEPTQVEKLIQKYFSDIPRSSQPPIKHDFRPVERKEPKFVCHADSECTSPVLKISYPLKTEVGVRKATMENLRKDTVHSLYNTMLNKRLQEIITECKSSPFILANSSKDELVDNLLYYNLTLVANDDAVLAAYRRLLLELKRVHEHGFLPEELESVKKSYKAQLEHLGMEKNNISNKLFAEIYISHFSKGSPFVDIAKILDIKKSLVEGVKLEHVNQWSKILTSNKGPVISTFLPDSIAHTVTPEILKKVADEVAVEAVAPYVNSIVERPLLRGIPKPGKVVKTTIFEKIGVTKWTLENGMCVYFRHSDQKKDSILIYATSVGGKLSEPFKQRAAADMAASLYAKSGVAGLTPSQLQKVLVGKSIGQRIIVGNYLTSLLTSSSKKDIDAAFQVLYTAFADRSFRRDAFDAIKKEKLNEVKHRENSPELLFNDTQNALCTQNHPAFTPITAEEYEKADYQDAVNFLNNQLQNPANFNLVITGNIDLEEAKGLVEKYFAGVPVHGGKVDFTSFKYPGYEYPSGIVAKEVEAGIASHCQAHFSFPSPAQDTQESRQLGMWTAQLLTMHLYERLRSGKVENYSIDCDYAISTLPGQEKTDPSSMELEISGLPENIRELNGIVLKEIEKLQNEGFTAEELSNFRTQVKEALRKSLDMDSMWLAKIVDHARWGWDMNAMIEKFNHLLDSFDEKMAQELLRKLFPLKRYVQLTQFPKKAEALKTHSEIIGS